MTKLTQKRELIYNILKSVDAPKSAEEILALVGSDLNLSTVYRALDKFYQQGIVSKNYLNNTAYYFINEHEHHHFMICEVCKEKFEMDCHIDEMIHDIEAKYGFVVARHDLNFYGICKNCKIQENS
ncbi:transcriptional repressor [Acholeplasma equirhinis]|uniref:Fur family transcriptional regulator n=1 Tax=Acholeplasma equirhinis TaxID=555393 RepID=UPI00197ADC09|nr:Fur family transcriptional regulator [Acholeplasma equirhinis]MBN3489943.1 transcriptional repressor [Acholeplasma equirhinis]